MGVMNSSLKHTIISLEPLWQFRELGDGYDVRVSWIAFQNLSLGFFGRRRQKGCTFDFGARGLIYDFISFEGCDTYEGSDLLHSMCIGD
jgi:hypothetical protein